MGSSLPCCCPRGSKGNTEKGSSREHCMDTKIFSTDRYTLTRAPLQYTTPHLRQEKKSRQHNQDFQPLAQGTAESTGRPGTHLTPPTYLTVRVQKQNTAMHSQSRPVLAQVVHVSYQPENTTAHQVEQWVSLFFHLPKGTEEFHSCNGNWTNDFVPFQTKQYFCIKTGRALRALLFPLVGFIDAFCILYPSRSTCQKQGANPMLKRRIKWDGCYEATRAAEDAAPPTVLTLSSDLQEHRQCPQPDEKHQITENHWKPLKLKNLTSLLVHTKKKTTERSPTFANFFSKTKQIHFDNIYSSEYNIF